MGIFGKKKDLLGEGGAGDVTLQAIGGEIKGKGFRKAKRAARRQARANRKAQRKVDKFGGRLEDYGGKKLGRVDQREADYFQDLRQERAKSIGKTTAIVAGTVATAGLGAAAASAGGLGAAISGAGGVGAAIGSGLGTIGTGIGSALGIKGAAAAGASGAGAAGAGAAGAGTAAATTAGTTAATTAGSTFLQQAGQQVGKQALKYAGKKAAQAIGSSGAEGAFNVDPTKMAQFEQQMRQMQMGPMMFAPLTQPVMPSTYQAPDFIGPPEYTASSVYDPFAYSDDE
jgi:hypothetical protein|tara:strand:- start:1330 stop:2184 length:855 start_codon:yes stop_codon:yes gene_type:complete